MYKDGMPVPTGWIPALAIPVATKSQFVCPEYHIKALAQKLPQVDKILIVGWRATEHNFLEILAKGLCTPVKTLVVCGTTEYAEQAS